MNETAVNNFDDHSKVVSEQTRLWGPQKVQIYVFFLQSAIGKNVFLDIQL